MIKKVILYLFIFLLSLCLFLVSMLPANLVWEKGLAPQLNTKRLGIDVQQVVGTVWSGQALVAYKSLPGILRWDIDLKGLLTLSLPVSFNLESTIGQVDANLTLTTTEVSALIPRAQIELKPLTPFFKAQRVSLDGELLVKDLALFVENNKIVHASGIASWSGGDIAYPAGRAVHERSFPIFKAVLETKQKGDIYLGIRDPQATFDVINADLKEDGTAMLRITRRLLDLSNEPWSQNSTEQDVVFKVKKVLY